MSASARTLSILLLLGLVAGIPSGVAAQEEPAPPPTHEFRVLLLEAGSGEARIPELEPDAVAALEDVRSVLPYERFELIDAGWIRTSRGARVTLGELGSFEVQVFIDPDESTPARLQIRSFELHHTQIARGAERSFLTGDPRLLLATSFGIRVGETVVVGTPRAEGQRQALVVLLQAVR